MPHLATKTGAVFFNQKGDPGEPGKPGENGKIGPLVYPAGEYSDTATYIKTDLSTPVVLCENEYYVLNSEEPVIGINPKLDYSEKGDKAHWIRMTKFKYAFIEVLMANFAKLASAIFSGDYMFSQYGKDAAGNETNEYKNFGTGNFFPNLQLDFLKGKFKSNEAEIEGIIKGGYQNKCIPVDMNNMTELLSIDLSKGSDYVFYVNKGSGRDRYVSLPTDKKYIGISIRISLFAVNAYATITFRKAVYRLRLDKSDQVQMSLNSFIEFVGVSSVGQPTVDNPSGVGDTCEWRIVNSGDFVKATNTEGKVYFKSAL